jgi:hypothetical protein
VISSVDKMILFLGRTFAGHTHDYTMLKAFSYPYSGVIKTPNGALFFANQAFANRMAA